MDGWNPTVAAASDHEPSSSEGEYMVEHGHDDEIQGAPHTAPLGTVEGSLDGGGTVGTVGVGLGLGISDIPVGHRDDKELKYLHLLWEPRGAEIGGGPAAGVASRLGKMTGTRARRHHRAVRCLGPIGKDIYGKLTFTGKTLNCGRLVLNYDTYLYWSSGYVRIKSHCQFW